ncbi:hypothetical protein N7457_008326 [Penicillium paradoxum]|uniref:uncharacterized protein n=1 Tax=Penicillium paradoxum TaxID=176176 RepID=UPI002547A48C|nr:uncharacterized protein N7457_008326 [Penicillium paradoxum]KAJ5773430.1 hypothetical protein N7457_008326 [Penicillium paradoxum]
MASDMPLSQTTKTNHADSILHSSNHLYSRNLDWPTNPWEMSYILDFRKENGWDLLSDNTNSEASRPRLVREWTSDALRAFDRVWCDLGKTERPGRYQSENTVRSGTSAASRRRQTLPPDASCASSGTMTLEQSHQYWDMTKQARRPSPKPISRFYKPRLLKEKLLGPENYEGWAEQMRKQLEQCGALWITDADAERPHGTSSAQSINPDLNLWMMIFSNVSRPIRRELGTLETLDSREAWQFLQRMYGRYVHMKMRSVQGLRDIMGIKYDGCASLEEYIGKMVVCIRAIQCNHGEKAGDDGGKDTRCGKNRNHRRGEDNEWLWCQFILVNLGPEWESWVSELVDKFEGGQRMKAAMSTLKGLLPIIEAEEARRIQASRYMKRCST